jgi:hypothetical protein
MRFDVASSTVSMKKASRRRSTSNGLVSPLFELAKPLSISAINKLLRPGG